MESKAPLLSICECFWKEESCKKIGEFVFNWTPSSLHDNNMKIRLSLCEACMKDFIKEFPDDLVDRVPGIEYQELTYDVKEEINKTLG